MVSDKFLGRIRLEAATGEDVSEVVTIPRPDGMMERALQFVKWLAKENPQGRWDYFLTEDHQHLRWDRVIIATSANVNNDAKRAHSSVVPGGAAVKDAAGRFLHEAVWRYLFTHPVEQTGNPQSPDPDCRMDLRQPPKKGR